MFLFMLEFCSSSWVTLCSDHTRNSTYYNLGFRYKSVYIYTTGRLPWICWRMRRREINNKGRPPLRLEEWQLRETTLETSCVIATKYNFENTYWNNNFRAFKICFIWAFYKGFTHKASFKFLVWLFLKTKKFEMWSLWCPWLVVLQNWCFN